MNPKPTNDPFGIEAAFKKISDAYNEGVEQAKRQRECGMRRFQLIRHGSIKVLGVALPGGTVVVQSILDKSVSIFNAIEDVENRYLGDIQWIDPEPAA